MEPETIFSTTNERLVAVRNRVKGMIGVNTDKSKKSPFYLFVFLSDLAAHHLIYCIHTKREYHDINSVL